ncbi:MAG: ArnT family glycosyltransferase, partial [Candidatus Bathyarchaeia archaeon]
PSLLYSTLFFQLSSTAHSSLAFFPILFGLGCTFCVYALAHTSLDRQTSALSAIIFAATPLFMACFTFSYLYSADLFALFFFSTALYTYHLAQEGESRGMAVVSGLASCLAILSRSYCLFVLPVTFLLIHSFRYEKKKWQAIPMVFIALSVVVTAVLLRGGDLLLLALGTLMIVALFAFSPTVKVDVGDRWGRRRLSLIVLTLSSLGVFWYIRNFMLFGDPVYPHLGSLFHTSPLSDDFIGNLFHEVSNIYWRPVGESAHIGSLLNTLLVPLLSFDFGIFLFFFKIFGFLTLLWDRNPLRNLISPWIAISYVTWFFLFNYSSNYLIQILPPLSIICAVGMMAVYGRMEQIVGFVLREERAPKIFALTTVFSLFGYYLLYYLDLKRLIPDVLHTLLTEALFFKPPFLENISLSLLPFLVLPFALLYSIIKGSINHSFKLGVDGRKKSLTLTALLVGFLLTFNFYVAPQDIIGLLGGAELGGIFSRGEAQELEAFIEHEVPLEEIIVSLTPEPMRMLTDRDVIYFFTPGGMFKLKDLLLMDDEAAIIETLRERRITWFIVPEPPEEGTDVLIYKTLKSEMIYNSYLFLAQRFRVFNLLQCEEGPFKGVSSNGSYTVYQLA